MHHRQIVGARGVRALVRELLQLEEYVDLIIPRGGEELIRAVAGESRVPVIKHYKGVCHVYVDAEASLGMAQRICLNAKVQRPSVCNAMETLLVHEAVAGQYTTNEQGMVVPVGADLPAPNDCGNNFSRVIEAHREWFLHLIPFELLQQQPLPNRQPGGIERSAIIQFSLNVPKDSNIELWLDDLGFYRRASSADAGAQP